MFYYDMRPLMFKKEMTDKQIGRQMIGIDR